MHCFEQAIESFHSRWETERRRIGGKDRRGEGLSIMQSLYRTGTLVQKTHTDTKLSLTSSNKAVPDLVNGQALRDIGQSSAVDIAQHWNPESYMIQTKEDITIAAFPNKVDDGATLATTVNHFHELFIFQGTNSTEKKTRLNNQPC